MATECVWYNFWFGDFLNFRPVANVVNESIQYIIFILNRNHSFSFSEHWDMVVISKVSHVLTYSANKCIYIFQLFTEDVYNWVMGSC